MSDVEKYEISLYAISKMENEELRSVQAYYLIHNIIDYEGSSLSVDEYIRREIKRREMEENG